jgi:UDP-N-acetylmuramoyl-tripeptide--D-alanyl-D-alanine ligase
VLTLAAARIAEVTGGTLVQGSGDAIANGVSTDSRDIPRGCAFVALTGERTDGHEFLAAALEAGARVLIVSRFNEAEKAAVEGINRADTAVVLVSDGRSAAGELARYHRSRLSCPVVGITGSTGKTTTKDFVTAALSTKLRVTATRANQNNELGVPLTVLDAGSETDVLVVEMGMRGLGQIESLCSIARPTLGLVTNIGQAHVELLGSVEAILHAKGELVRCVPAEGRVFLNGDDEWTRRLESEAVAPVTTYGTGDAVDVRACDITVDDQGLPTMRLVAGSDEAEVTLPIPGRHNAYSAAAAAAIGLHLGIGLSDVAEGLSTVVVTDMRMQTFTAANGVTVINDAYNANPASMKAAISALMDVRGQGRHVAVLGDMAELGSFAELAHFQLGERVARSGVDVLVTSGALAARIGEGARADGMDPEKIRTCANVDEASEVLDDLLEPGDVVLVKASRVIGLERVVEGILRPRA